MTSGTTTLLKEPQESSQTEAEKELAEIFEKIEAVKKKKKRRTKKELKKAREEILQEARQIQRQQQAQAEQERQLSETLACLESFAYFVDKYCWIYDGTTASYVPFHLWPGQMEAVKAVEENRLLLILKARQLGMTWLCLAYALWLMNFRDDVTVLVFSLRDSEACELVARLHEMHRRLPDWLRVKCVGSNAHSMVLANGSKVMAFPTTAGDSYNATLAIVDEADLVPDLDRMMGRVKPTIDAGGKFFLVSRSDKKYPDSFFKKQFKAIIRGDLPGWKTVFLPWNARPERDARWYEEQKQFSLSTTGALDWLHEQYPATPEEALSANTLDKRIPPEWLQKCYKEMKPIAHIRLKVHAPLIPQMRVYAEPNPRRLYVAGADPAQGNPNSDDSSLIVLDKETGEECCNVVGKFEPAVFGSMIDKVCRWYNCAALIERNNHGHAVLLWLNDHGKITVMEGPDGDKGFYTTSVTKIKGYDDLVESVRSGKIMVHDYDTFDQLANLEAATLSAPEGLHDDRAIAFMLANFARGKAINYGQLQPLKVDPKYSQVLTLKKKGMM